MAFLVLFLAYVIGLGVLLIIYPKGAMELWVNQHIRADSLFFWITFLGDGIFYVVVSLLMALKNKRWAGFALLCYAVTGIIAQFLKIVIFPDSPRPSAFFGQNIPLHFVEGVELHTSNSFPSGHTTSAFSLALVLSLYGRQGWISIVCFLGAVLVGFSRVYLMQHFFIDTYFGAYIGVLVSFALYQFLGRFLKHKKKTS
jgi:membrane-associated phospholipid phosphatase